MQLVVRSSPCYLLMSVVILTLCIQSDGLSDMVVEPTQQKLPVGHTAKFECSHTNSNDVVSWVTADGYNIREMNTTKYTVIATTHHLQLEIHAVTMNDTGMYTCVSDLLNNTVHLDVYVINNYMIYGIVINSVNVALLIAIIGCLCRSCTMKRRRHRHQLVEKVVVTQ